VDLTIVVPAYNEESRIPKMLDETLAYLKERQSRDPSFTFEIVVVNDCSKDRTINVVMEYVAREGTDRIRLMRLARNRGKGGAIRRVIYYKFFFLLKSFLNIYHVLT
jgi:dolichyl-phosphate beta-glucosyltransferase